MSSVLKFTKLLQEERERQGISLRRLAQNAGVTHMSLYRWECGSEKITLANADKVLTALGVSMVIGKQEGGI